MRPPALIFPGRFQPFHDGHDEVVQSVLDAHRPPHLVLAVVFDVSLSKSDEFDAASAEHFRPERNPFDPLTVHDMLQRFMTARHPGRVQVVMIPRPARGRTWQLLERMLPAQRSWVVPDAGEAWDERKAAFFAEMGEAVLRVPHRPDVSGRELRAAMSRGDWQEVARQVPAGLVPLLRGAYGR